MKKAKKVLSIFLAVQMIVLSVPFALAGAWASNSSWTKEMVDLLNTSSYVNFDGEWYSSSDNSYHGYTTILQQGMIEEFIDDETVSACYSDVISDAPFDFGLTIDLNAIDQAAVERIELGYELKDALIVLNDALQEFNAATTYNEQVAAAEVVSAATEKVSEVRQDVMASMRNTSTLFLCMVNLTREAEYTNLKIQNYAALSSDGKDCYRAYYNVPMGVKVLHSGACSDYTDYVYLPKSLKEIKAGAFFDFGDSLKTIKYGGTAEQWKQIEIDEQWNENLLNASVICGAKSPLEEEIDARMAEDGYSLLPNSAEGLSMGDYWFNWEAFFNSPSHSLEEDDSERFLFYYNFDTNKVRTIWLQENGSYSYSTYGEDGDEHAIYYPGIQITWNDLIMQVGVDPLDGFTLLAHSKEEMAPGDIFYIDGSYSSVSDTEFYIKADGSEIKENFYGVCRSYTVDHWYYSILHEVPAPVFDGFTLLPTSPEGLADGAYWIDRPSDLEYYYLSADGQTLRKACNRWYYTDEILKDSYLGNYIRQVGVDPFAGFVQLPFSPDGLPAGSKWFDKASFLSDNNLGHGALSDWYLYLSEDGTTLKMAFEDFVFEVSNNGSAEEVEYFNTYSNYIKTVEGAPHTHSYTSSITTTATCMEKGIRTYTCTCGNSYTEEIPVDPTAHAALNENGDCPRCGKHVKNVEEPTNPSESSVHESNNVGSGSGENLNFFQRIIQWFRNFFAKLFGKKAND